MHPLIIPIEISDRDVKAGTINGRAINAESGYFLSFDEAKKKMFEDQEKSVAQEIRLLDEIKSLAR